MEEWKTPKIYQKAWEKFHAGKARLPFRGYCRKLKTKHDFQLFTMTTTSLLPETTFIELRCRGCNKKKIKAMEDRLTPEKK